ncbi:NUDIX domain-containing protein [Prevotella melaninogenica]
MNKYYKGEPKLLVSVDCIVLGFENKKLQLLVGKRKVEPYSGKLSLYGGFVRENESLKEAANRVLFQCTGINDIYMRQVEAFGETDRDPGDRVISIAYCALINVSDYDKKLLEENDLQWVDINKLPELYGDHIEMVQIALSQLRKLINKDPLGFNLLPELFTLTQLQNVHEAIMGVEIDKRNFRKRIKQIDFIEKTKYIDKITSKRGAALYRINKQAYSDASL